MAVGHDDAIIKYRIRRYARLIKRVARFDSKYMNFDASSRLVYGLCKGAGIDTHGMDPEQAWKALAEKTGKSVGEHYAEANKSVKVKVDGPRTTKKFLKDYVKKNPKIMEEAKPYKKALRNVKNFLNDYPDAENYNTYDAMTGKKLENLKGAFVTFHQNDSLENPYGGYDDDDYALMCAIAKKELGSDGVFIGYYGNPEISFNCQDLDKAMKFAKQHNQNSVYNGDTEETIYNPDWNRETNPIKLDED